MRMPMGVAVAAVLSMAANGLPAWASSSFDEPPDAAVAQAVDAANAQTIEQISTDQTTLGTDVGIGAAQAEPLPPGSGGPGDPNFERQVNDTVQQLDEQTMSGLANEGQPDQPDGPHETR
jgi:hypothetical protein